MPFVVFVFAHRHPLECIPRVTGVVFDDGFFFGAAILIYLPVVGGMTALFLHRNIQLVPFFFVSFFFFGVVGVGGIAVDTCDIVLMC